MIDRINSMRSGHIVTIEDPIEFLHRDKKAFVSQREVEVDTRSFAEALRGALRQDPDVILVGEMRDLETIDTALTAAETGHLVLSTLHTLDATETITRIISAFPPHQQKQVRLQLGSVLRGVISQRLVPRADGKGRVAAVEVLVANSRIREMVEDKDRTKEITAAISQSHTTYGMQTFDQSLMTLFRQNIITYEEAVRQSSNPDDFALRVSGISATSDSTWGSFDQKPEDGGQPAAAKPGASAGRPAAASGPRPAAAPPPSSGAAPGRISPASRPSPPGQAAAAPAAPAEDDFQIERF